MRCFRVGVLFMNYYQNFQVHSLSQIKWICLIVLCVKKVGVLYLVSDIRFTNNEYCVSDKSEDKEILHNVNHMY